jgi:hypothetical protein
MVVFMASIRNDDIPLASRGLLQACQGSFYDFVNGLEI